MMLTLQKLGLCGASNRLNGMLKAKGVKNSQVTIMRDMRLIPRDDAKLFHKTSDMLSKDSVCDANSQQTIFRTWNNACLPKPKPVGERQAAFTVKPTTQ